MKANLVKIKNQMGLPDLMKLWEALVSDMCPMTVVNLLVAWFDLGGFLVFLPNSNGLVLRLGTQC